MCNLVAAVNVPFQNTGFVATWMSKDLQGHMIYIQVIACSSWIGEPWLNWEE